MKVIHQTCLKYFLLDINLLFISTSLVLTAENENVNCDLTKVWGPGLTPETIVMPARYFFITAVGFNEIRLNKSPGKNIFDVKIYGAERKCRIWTEMLDRQDGSFIVRYKLYETCFHLTISIKCQKKDFQNFPLHFNNAVYSDECSCALNNDMRNWLSSYGCPKKYKQIEFDLKSFDVVDFNDIYPLAKTRLFNDTYRISVCHYIIKMNKLYRTCYGQYTDFKMFWDAILMFFVRKVRLPDLELIVNLGDWPLISKTSINPEELLLPVFSWCGSEDTLDIVVPTYDITESALENMGRVTLDMLSVQGNIEKLWDEKIPKLFWRGRDSSRERLKLIQIARQYSSLINASLTDFFFFRDKEQIYGPKEKRIPFFKFFDYKYQLNLDGTVAAYRFPYLLVSDSLVFKQDSQYYEYFYKELEEWKHFIPVKRDLSNLVENIKWAIAHDREAHDIAINGLHYARNNLLPLDIFCYHATLLNEYSKKMINKNIVVRPGMEEVLQKNKHKCDCDIFSSANITNIRYQEDL